MITIPSNGSLNYGAHKMEFRYMPLASSNKISFDVYDTDKFQYEEGYCKTVTRVVSKKKTIRYAGYTYDLKNIGL